MKKRFLVLLPVLFLLSISALAQTPKPSRTPPPSSPDRDVVVITTNLIQVDATVLDKNGKIVADLKPEDFEIYENDKLQPITNFSFVGLTPETGTANSNAKAEKSNKNALPLPPVPFKLRPEQVKRTMALVVDDLGLSFGSIKWVKDLAALNG